MTNYSFPSTDYVDKPRANRTKEKEKELTNNWYKSDTAALMESQPFSQWDLKHQIQETEANSGCGSNFDICKSESNIFFSGNFWYSTATNGVPNAGSF